MNIQSRIYAGGALAFGGQAAVANLIQANYSSVIIWSVHVDGTGNLILNNTMFVSGGVYKEAEEMDIPSKVAQLHKAGVQVIFSVGAGGTQDFENIHTLLNGGVPGKGNALYDNFAALKAAMVAAGGDIDAIDFDNEDYMGQPDTVETMVNFGCMLGNIGYSSVTFCPYGFISTDWTDTYTQLLAKKGNSFVSAIHLQCYSGGSDSIPGQWGAAIASAQGNTLLIPGLATNQAGPGPWWYVPYGQKVGQRGSSVVQTNSVAMYGAGDWSGMLWQGNFASADDAMQNVKGGETFFFYCNGYLDLGPGKQFQAGDAVFFGGLPWWGSAPQCDGFSLSGGCSDIYNPVSTGGACPANLQQQYATWNKGTYPVNGGFIWLYDSIVSCVLSDCCGEGNETTAQVAADYRNAIVNGLS